ncbi:MAG: hypothetical protein OEL81_03315 [Nitrosopumilus sp.]|nr:hypothetical protein [Nitrosopumilus sp.]
MALEKWLAITSVALFAMFAGEMISIYNFMITVPDDFEFAQVFEADPKILQFISIGAAPAGVLAGVAFIMSKHYGSKPIGGLIIAGGIIMLLGMAFCYSLLEEIEDVYLTDAVLYMPILFMVLSIPVVSFGIYLIKHKKIRPKKQYF